MGTERRLPVSDAEVLAACRAGESQRALAVRFKVSKGAVQKAIARAEACERSAEPSTPADSIAASGARPMSSRDIRKRLEHEAVHAGDSRTRLNALKMLQELNAEPGGSRQSEAARNKQYLSESGYFFGPGSLVIERRSGRFRAFERTRGGWEPAPVDLDTQEGRVALLVALVEIFREAPLPAAHASAIDDLLTATSRDSGEESDNLTARGAELALNNPDAVNGDEHQDAEKGLPDGGSLVYPRPNA